MLLRWSRNDPVSEKETSRNNAVFEIQHNRNPFVDFPGLEEYVWGNKIDLPFYMDNALEEQEAAQPLKVYSSDGCIYVYTHSNGQFIEVYNLQGKLLARQMIDALHHSVNVSAGQLVIVKVGSKTAKVLTK
jgi:hypothetical protein